MPVRWVNRRIWVSKRTSFVAVAMIAMSLFILGAFVLVAENLGRAVAQWQGKSRVDVFFESLATAWPTPGVGVLLTGMGSDGARGLGELRKRGWHTIAQDRSTSVVYGMPKVAAELGAAVEILPLPQIGLSVANRLAPRA